MSRLHDNRTLAGPDLLHGHLALAAIAIVLRVLIEEGSGFLGVAGLIDRLTVGAGDRNFATSLAAIFRLRPVRDASPWGWGPIRASSETGESQSADHRESRFDRFHGCRLVCFVSPAGAVDDQTLAGDRFATTQGLLSTQCRLPRHQP